MHYQLADLCQAPSRFEMVNLPLLLPERDRRKKNDLTKELVHVGLVTELLAYL